jgi:hypothetical protein
MDRELCDESRDYALSRKTKKATEARLYHLVRERLMRTTVFRSFPGRSANYNVGILSLCHLGKSA